MKTAHPDNATILINILSAAAIQLLLLGIFLVNVPLFFGMTGEMTLEIAVKVLAITSLAVIALYAILLGIFQAETDDVLYTETLKALRLSAIVFAFISSIRFILGSFYLIACMFMAIGFLFRVLDWKIRKSKSLVSLAAIQIFAQVVVANAVAGLVIRLLE